MMGKDEDVIEIDISRLLLALWHRLWVIVLAVLVGGGIALAITLQFIYCPQICGKYSGICE
ncbi:MAG: Wzz/FepE/Etk N-terminal domain-containing protein, partial [Lachnospiraceae bacterium]|nr:Wzz/FepE/Etk N-terminal domain-containing protein [Lachnospiraceae bacterium]